jgi:hypothetical protein
MFAVFCLMIKPLACLKKRPFAETVEDGVCPWLEQKVGIGI